LRKSLYAIALVLLLFSASASALYLDVSSTVVIQEEQKDIPIAIRNDSYKEENYSIEFSAPFEAIVGSYSGKLGAGKATIATLSIMPNEELAGSTYEGTLEVSMGEEKVSRKIRVLFKEEEILREEPVEENSLTGFYTVAGSVLTLENALNAFLAVIAAVLLIAFIARYVKRLEAKK